VFWELFIGTVVSIVGAFYFRAGRRDQEPVRLLCGFGMMIAPWFLTSLLPLLATVLVLAFLPSVLERFG
jgi:hypothetical protein